MSCWMNDLNKTYLNLFNKKKSPFVSFNGHAYDGCQTLENYVSLLKKVTARISIHMSNKNCLGRWIPYKFLNLNNRTSNTVCCSVLNNLSIIFLILAVIVRKKQASSIFVRYIIQLILKYFIRIGGRTFFVCATSFLASKPNNETHLL